MGGRSPDPGGGRLAELSALGAAQQDLAEEQLPNAELLGHAALGAVLCPGRLEGPHPALRTHQGLIVLQDRSSYCVDVPYESLAGCHSGHTCHVRPAKGD